MSLLCTVVITSAALGQPEGDQEPRIAGDEAERAIRELFEGLQLDDEADPAEQRRRVEELQRRVIELRVDGVVQLDQGRAAEPMPLDTKPIVNPWAKRSRDAVIAGLDHADFAVRESAEAFLLTDNTLDKAALQQLIQQAKSPEQRQRLLRVAEHHVLRGMRERDFGNQPQAGDDEQIDPFRDPSRSASVGYSYEPVLAHENPDADLPGVRVTATMPGFPGHAHFRRGDIIVQINGQGLSNHHREHEITNWVRSQIASHEAGDTIGFTIQRGGKLLAVEVVCAEGPALDHMYTTDGFDSAARKGQYQREWEAAHHELAAQMPKPKVLTPVVLEAKDEAVNQAG